MDERTGGPETDCGDTVCCEICGEETSPYCGRTCDKCGNFLCDKHPWELGDDITGDKCPICGEYDNI